MENKFQYSINFVIGMILIFLGILIFFGFFFSFIFIDNILDNPFSFIVLFFAMFFIIALIMITGTFFIQKSVSKPFKNFNLSERNEYQLNSLDEDDFNPEKMKENFKYMKYNYCQKCGSQTYEDESFCLNCGNRI